ncbi:PepSY-associated TM helix domain-containing protein [Acinetobacter shaoyimingii]|uniref:PepSY domain-containing protein n=1 Tax=Acinetobacter shaoyimingii TaxID=2715164 RepID=A0A6G8RUX0_9GAMM|nr:PepSY-associated TM helix domain-containing protein [Acinetobacter shaoyimingii]QIO05732.1 PepSY domain-containing protein [Acinetobacter shaoyimingii]
MQKSIRQSMAWLHSWTGLLFGWLLFAIFLMGAVSYYRHEINLWMQPELASIQLNQQQSIQNAYQYLEKNAPDAKRWYIDVASAQEPVNLLIWEKSDGGFERMRQDPVTGEILKKPKTQGGEFFYQFHYQLFGLPAMIGRMITTFAAFIMLIALISGIITHKKIFVDFFTLRAFKGQRSYLDFHNITSVIAIPFFLTITFTGIAIFFYIYLPWGMKSTYPDRPFQYFEEIRNVDVVQNINSQPAKMLPIQTFLNTAEQKWGPTQFEVITIKNPNTTNAVISLMESKDQSISQNRAQITFNATNAKALTNTRNESAVATLSYSMYGLHMGTFATPLLRLTLFFSGILGALMIASGLLLWSLKRQIQNKQQRFHFGHYLVNRLNISALIGLPIAILSYFYANRLGLFQPQIGNYEIHAFFYVWLCCLIFALITQQHLLWKNFLKVFVLLALCLPILNLYCLSQNDLLNDFSTYSNFLGVDLMILVFGMAALFIHQKIQPIQIKATQKINSKLEQQRLQENI